MSLESINLRMNTWTKQCIDNDMMWPAKNLIRMFKGKNYPDCHLYKNDF